MAKGRKRRASAQTDEGHQQNEMTAIARTVRKAIKYIAAALVGLFAYLQLKDFKVGPAIEAVSPDLVRRLTMIAYYWCWVFGTTYDTDIQELAYFTEKGHNQLTGNSFGLMALFGVVMGALLWSSYDDRYFAAALTAFFLFNIGGFVYILWFVAPIIKSSETRYREGRSYFGMAQLEVVSEFMNGEWQRYRFVLGLVLVVLMNVICFSDVVRTSIAQGVAELLKIEPTTLAVRLPTFTFVIFVAALEGWIWIERARVMVALRLLDDLNRKYRLESRPPAAEKAPAARSI